MCGHLVTILKEKAVISAIHFANLNHIKERHLEKPFNSNFLFFKSEMQNQLQNMSTMQYFSTAM